MIIPEMEEGVGSISAEGEIVGIQFGLASHREIRASSISDCSISHASQLANPFLGLPLETGKCESCGTAEPGKCEGHFGYIELPIPLYHPAHISELKRMLSLVCLKCLKMKANKVPVKNNGVMERLLSACCEEASHVSIKEHKSSDGASFLELRIPGRSRMHRDAWNFLERFGYRYGDGPSRTLLASEVLMMLKKLPGDTRRKLAKKGYFPQDGYILRYLPVPPNCLSVPDVSDGVSVMSSDLCSAMLKKVLRQIDIIRSSRSGDPNFESHEVEANDLQIAVANYLDVRGTGKGARDRDNRFGVSKEGASSSTKAWLAKMRTLFISKGSGFSSRSVITGDAYTRVNEVGIPSEVAQKMTFEERVNVHNIQYLQRLVDTNLCLTFRDGSATYSLREGSKGHTFLKIGQVVHRRIMDGDLVFINRPPTTHKHSLQALHVYIHEDHVVKINPLMCGPLAADFDGDCVHLFYPQSLSARAEVLELFSVDKQLLSSHSGNLNLQLAADALLSLKTLFNVYFMDKASAQQLAMHASSLLPPPAVLKACSSGPRWSALQVLQTALPSDFECHGEKVLVRGGEVVKLDYSQDVIASIINDITTSLYFSKSPKEALNLFDCLQPLLMESLFGEGFSVCLRDFYVPLPELENLQEKIQDMISPLLFQLRSSFNDLMQLQYESEVKELKLPLSGFVMRSSALGCLMDARSESAIEKVVQQIGFLGLQLSNKRKFYSRSLVEEVASFFKTKNPSASLYPSEEFGLVKSGFFRGLDPYEGIVHSIATREVIVRSSKGLAEPGTLFKNLMAVLRDVVICYDGTIRNVSTQTVIQFDYGLEGVTSQSLFPAGEPVGVLAATAMSNPAYKAVLDSSPNSNSSWDLMKEILFCHVNFKNDTNDRRVILYLNDCGCGKKYCQENASFLVKNHLKKVSLRDAALEFSIEYRRPKAEPGSLEVEAGLVGHIHLNATLLKESSISIQDVLQKCEEQVNILRKKKKFGYCFRRIELSVSKCSFLQKQGSRSSDMPCLKFFWQDLSDQHLEKIAHIMVDMICPVLLDTVIKGDPRISSVNIVWISPGTTSWVQSPGDNGKGELGVEVSLEKSAVRQCGDAWRIVLDCCLPVFHLIDSRRSIPYAIKQIQDLFGISCAFDQAVQRLSTSVTMVTRGVLKEHLILLASSMTCSGNLVGFNMSGIKALCRALSAQVPFTEATLYTPRKCFERASEKCHVDALAGIVASCSWGKRVAVGTGTKFDILWDTHEVGTSEKPIDVYNFLHLVRSSDELEIDTGGLGEDVDKFGLEDAYMEPALSPDQEIKAVFEDAIDLGLDSKEQGGADSSWDALPSSGKGQDVGTSSAEGNDWATWGSQKDQVQPKDLNKPDRGNALPASGEGWNAVSGSAVDDGWADWGSKKGQSQPEDSSTSGGWGVTKSDSKTEDKNQPSWSEKTVPNDGDWGSKKGQVQPENSSKPGGWGATKSDSEKEGKSQPSWSKKSAPNDGDWGSNKGQVQSKDSPTPGGWGAGKSNSETEGKSQPSWSKKSAPNDDGWNKPSDNSRSNNNGTGSGWGASKVGSGSWGSQKEESQALASWEQKTDNSGSADRWRSDKTQNSGGWSSVKGQKSHENASGWGSAEVSQQAGSGSWGLNNMGTQPHSSWQLPKKSSTSSGNWNSDKPRNENVPGSWDSKKDEVKSPWAQRDNSPGKISWEPRQVENNSQSSWSKQRNTTCESSEQAADGWDSRKSVQPSNSGGWGSGKAEPGSSNKVLEEDNLGAWESKSAMRKTEPSWIQPSQSTAKSTIGADAWGSDKSNLPGNSCGWGVRKAVPDSSNEAHEKDCSGAWNSQTGEEKIQSGWGSRKVDPGNLVKAYEVHTSGDWDSKSGDRKAQSSWEQSNEFGKSSGWGTQKGDHSGSDMAHEDKSGSWDSQSEKNKTQPSWGQPTVKSSPVDGWGPNKSNNPGNSSAWGSGKADSSNSSGWSSGKANTVMYGDKKRPEGGRGWGSSNSGEWKSRKNRPPRQPGVNDDSSNVSWTATRKRMDIFPEEEKHVLTEVELIMQSIRRIMHQSGCSDGEPLPAEDQLYVINNVLAYHPDKAAKTGSGVDYLTVKKHGNFQDSRCFFVMKTDGESEDFSYIKCLENFIKEKYPSIAESFNSKYFRKPRSGVNQQQAGGNQEQAGGNQQAEGNQQQAEGSQQCQQGFQPQAP